MIFTQFGRHMRRGILPLVLGLCGCDSGVFTSAPSSQRDGKSTLKGSRKSGDAISAPDGSGSGGQDAGTSDAGRAPSGTGQDGGDITLSTGDEAVKAAAAASGSSANGELQTSDAEVTPVPLPLDFVRFPDTAAHNNCLYLAVNDQPEKLFGCNHTGGASGSITVLAKPLPVCNTVHLRMTSNNQQVWTTVNSNDISRYFKLEKPAANTVKVQANDNGDNDFNDLNLTISGNGKVKFKIENSSLACD